MSDAGGPHLNVHIDIIPDLSKAIAEFDRLSALAAKPGPDQSQHAAAFAKQAQEIEHLLNLYKDLSKAQNAYFSDLPKGQRPRIQTPYQLTTEVTKTKKAVQASGTGKGPAEAVEIIEASAGNVRKRRQYSAVPAGQANLTIDERAEIREKASAARSKGRRLDWSAGDTPDAGEFRKVLLRLDTASKVFFAAMEEMRSGSEDFNKAAVRGAVAQRELEGQVMAAARAEERYVVATVDLARSRRRLAEEVTLARHGVSAQGKSSEEVTDLAAELNRRERGTTRTRQVEGVGRSEIDERIQGDVAAKNLAGSIDAVRAKNEAYVGAVTGSIKSHDALQAQLKQVLSADQSYIATTASLTQSRKRLTDEATLFSAGVRTKGLSETEIKDQAAEARRRQRLADTTRQTEAIGRPEIDERIQGDVAAKNLAGSTDRVRAANDEYIGAVTGATAAHQTLRLKLEESLVADQSYIEATAGLAQQRRRSADLVELARAGESGSGLSDVEAGDRAAELRRRRTVTDKTRRTEAVGRPEIDERVQGDSAARELAGSIDGARAQNERYIESVKLSTVAHQQLQEKLALVLNADQAYIESTAAATQSRRRTSDLAELARAGESGSGLSDVEAGDRAAELRRRRGLTTVARRTAGVGDEEIGERADLVAEQARLAAATREATAQAEGYVDDVRRSRASSRDLNAQIKNQTAGFSQERVAAAGGNEQAAAAAGFVLATRRRADTYSNLTDQEIAEAGVSRAQQAKTTNAMKKREKEILTEQIKGGALGGSWWQRTQAVWSPGAGKTPQEFQKGPEFLKSRAATTLGYAVGGVAAGALFTTLTDAIKDASTLQATFVRLQGQLKAMGKGEEFGNIRQAIKRVSSDTGIAANDVAEFESRMLGVFSDKGPAYAMAQTESAMKLMVVAGLDMPTMLQSVIPTAKAFNVEIEDIGNTAVEVGEQLGISEDQVIQFLGKSAIVAEQTGTSMRDLAVVGSTIAQNLGKDLASSADVFNKMPELIERNQDKIAQILEQSPEAAKFIPEFNEQIRTGDTGKAALTVIRASTKLEEQQKTQLPGLITNPREIEEGTAIISNAEKIVGRLDNKLFLAGKSSNALKDRFDKLRSTVEQTFERLKRSIEGFAESLLDAGLGDVFVKMGEAIEIPIKLLGILFEILGKVNDATKAIGIGQGIIPIAAQIALVIFAVRKAIELLSSRKISATATSKRAELQEIRESIARGKTTAAAYAEKRAIEASNAAGAARHGIPLPRVTKAEPVAGNISRVTADIGRGVEEKMSVRKYTQLVGQQFQKIREAELAALGKIGPFGGLMAGAGAAGSTPTKASWLSRAFAGGGESRLNPFRWASRTGTEAVETAGDTAGFRGLSRMGKVTAGAGFATEAFAVYSAWSNEKDQVQAASNDLREKMKTANREKLRSIATEGHSIVDTLYSKVFNTDLPDTMAKETGAYQDATPGRTALEGLAKSGKFDEYVKRLQGGVIKQINDFFGSSKERKELLTELGIFENEVIRGVGGATVLVQRPGEVTSGNVGELIKNAQRVIGTGGITQIDELAKFLNFLGTDIMNLPGMADLKVEVDKAAKANQVSKDYAVIKRLFDRGEDGIGEYLEKARGALAILRTQAADELDPAKKQEKLEEGDRVEKDIRDAANQAIKGRMELLIEIARSSGTKTPETDAMNIMMESVPRMSRDEQIASLPQLMDQAYKQWEEQLAAIADPVVRARKQLEGFTLPPYVQALITQTLVKGNEGMTKALGPVGDVLGKETEELTEWAATEAERTNSTFAQVILKALKDRSDALEKEARLKLGHTLTYRGVSKRIPFRGEIPGLPDFKKESRDFVRSQMGPGGDQAVAAISGYFNKNTDEMYDWMAEESLRTGKTIQQVFEAAMKHRIEEAIRAATGEKSEGGALITAGEQAGIDFLNGVLAQLPSLFGQPTDSAEVKFAKEKGAREKALADITADRKADIEIAAQGTRGNSLRQAQAGLDAAWLDYKDQLQLEKEEYPDQAKKKQAWLAVMQQQANVEDAKQASRQAQLDWAVINANGDPTAEAAGEYAKALDALAYALKISGGDESAENVITARQNLVKVGQKSAENARNVVRSRFAVRLAQAERDPVEAARLGLEQANYEAEQARGTVDENTKLAEQIKAQHGYADAISASFDAQSNLLIAIANANGDTVEAARLGAEQAQRKLDEAVAQGVTDPGALAGLQANIVTANENYARTGRQREESIIDFQQQMGYITRETAMESLRAILSRTKEGTDEYMQLASRIRTLEQEAVGAGLQFNLPSTLGLPTLYESRRLSQGTAAGIGYQDNRNMYLQFNVNGAQDTTLITNSIVAAFESAATSGRMYASTVPGVG